MDYSESLAREYLTHLGFKRIKYEPEGHKKFPDFLVEERIGIEVTRLEEHELPSHSGMKPPGLDEIDIPVWNNIRRFLPSFGPPRREVSWYVSIEYTRPVPRGREVREAVRQHLESFRDGPSQNPTTIRLFDNFTIELIHAGRSYADFFVMGSIGAGRSGALVALQLERNLKICIDHKTKTAEASGIRTKYPEWWLVLIDLISYGQWEAIRIPSHGWDKVILVNPLDYTQSIEV
jgi:hypothetical protein